MHAKESGPPSTAPSDAQEDDFRAALSCRDSAWEATLCVRNHVPGQHLATGAVARAPPHRNQVPSPPPAGGTGRLHRGLASMLARWLGSRDGIFRRDGSTVFQMIQNDRF